MGELSDFAFKACVCAFMVLQVASNRRVRKRFKLMDLERIERRLEELRGNCNHDADGGGNRHIEVDEE